MRKPTKKAPTKERTVQEEHLRAITGGSGYSMTTGDDGPPPDPNGGT